jgi:uncharacterized protein
MAAEGVINLGGLKLPVATAATKTFAILAKRRGGKTYTGSVLAEEFVEAGIPFYVLDPTGAWWGLRSSANGKRAGLPVIVVGGEHGDVPIELNANAGKALADLVVFQPSFYVLDVSEYESEGELTRFATAFLGRVHANQKKTRTVLHGIWDEADLFAPQQPDKDQTKMLHHAKEIVRRGGLFGEGTTLITQRAAVLNKNVLTQLDVLILLRMIGSQDIGAVEDYVKYSQETPERRRELLTSLPGLKIGEAQIYGPGEEPPLFDRVRIRKRRTFNSSATPEHGETVVLPTKLADVDVDGLREAMRETIERADAQDPAKLQQRLAAVARESEQRLARIRELEAELAERPAEVERVPILTDDAVDAVMRAATALSDAFHPIDAGVARLDAVVREMRAGVAAIEQTARVEAPAPRRPATTTPAAPPRPPAPSPSERYEADVAGNGEVQLGKAARALLGTLLAHRPRRLTRAELSTLSGYKPRSSTYRNALSALRTQGLLDEDGQTMAPSAEAIDVAGESAPPSPQTTEELLQLWYGALGAASRAMLQQLVDVYPAALSREEIAERTRYSLSSSTFRNGLSALRVNGLLDETGAGVGAATSLFIGART